MRRWQVVLGAVLTGGSLSAHAAELGIAAFNIAWAGSEADFNEHIRVCANPQVNWCDTHAKIAKGEAAPTPEEDERAKQCQVDFDTAAGGAAKSLLVAPCNAYKLTASKWKKALLAKGRVFDPNYVSVKPGAALAIPGPATA